MLALMSKTEWTGSTALVTGASSGLGEELARKMAARGARLVLVARSTEKLKILAAELSTLHAQAPLVISCDLAETGSAQRLYDRLRTEGVVVDHLVNNAGVGRAKAVTSDDPALLGRMVQLNCTSLSEMSALFLPGMIERGRGGILQVASVIGFSPCPYQAVYAATKAFVLSFTHGLAIELLGTGVHVTAVCPGHMRTGFQVSAGFSTNALPVPGELSAEKTASLALVAYERRRTVVVTGFVNRMSVFFGGLLPRSWIARLSARVLKKLGRFD